MLKTFDDIFDLKPGDVAWDHHNGIPASLLDEDIIRPMLAPNQLVDSLIAVAVNTCPTNKLVYCLQVEHNDETGHDLYLLGCRYDRRAYLFSILI